MLKALSLSCCRGMRAVFRNISFELAPGGLLLITGPNGSGKSSLLRLVAGLLPPLDGQLLWQNKPIAEDEDYQKRLHYIGHLDAVKPQLSVAETLAYWQALDNAAARENGSKKEFSDPFKLAAIANKTGRVLSAGQKRRAALTRLAMTDAPLWLLDEPTAALDDDGQKILAGLIAAQRAKGGIVLAAMHHAPAMPDAKILALPGAKA